ncbi:GDSL-like Lipase/Acylhydrolase family protein [Burkholderia humptydooensis]|nr:MULTISPECIES: SGNH/GDSL hydrolase family protein [Burkholderia]AJY39579.1 GDSL-like Lipase/Acylhydrolase family protein [Burkholderia sp. 2002721687]
MAKGVIASFLGMIVMACSACGGDGNNPGVNPPTQSASKSVASTCYVEGAKAGSACILDDQALARSVVQFGDSTRLKQVFEKARSGQPITIAAIGGSITQGAWATAPENRYVNRMFGWWQATFPQSKMTLINAGIGQTNSLYGQQRAQHDLFQYNPDFVIVEFANNDAITQQMQDSMRSLIRMILDSPSHPAVMMLFTMARDGTNSEDNQIPVGKEFNVPMVAVREAILPLEKSGQLDPVDITADPIHPNDLGHKILAQIVAYRLQSSLHE